MSDIMFPALNNAPTGPSERDFLTREALYELLNGTMVQ